MRDLQKLELKHAWKFIKSHTKPESDAIHDAKAPAFQHPDAPHRVQDGEFRARPATPIHMSVNRFVHYLQVPLAKPLFIVLEGGGQCPDP